MSLHTFPARGLYVPPPCDVELLDIDRVESARPGISFDRAFAMFWFAYALGIATVLAWVMR